MSNELPTASSLQRVMQCGLSAQLPQVHEENEHAAKGNALHRYLELVAYNPSGAAAVDWRADKDIPAEHHQACEAIDLSSLPPLERTEKEITFALDYVTGHTRILGRSLARDYSAATASEFVGTADVLGFVPGDSNALVVLDYKTGFARSTPPASNNWQLNMLGLCAAKAYGASAVNVGIIRTLDRTRADMHVLDAMELVGIEASLAGLGAKLAAGKTLPARTGDHCRYCPSAHVCPAQVAMIEKFIPLALEKPDSIYGMLNRDNAALVYERLHMVSNVINKAKQQMAMFAERNPFDLPNGKRYGAVEVTKEELDAAVAYRVIKESCGQAGVEAAVTFDVAKAGIERMARAIAPKGQAAALVRDTLSLIAQAGGIKVKTSKQIKEFKPGADDE